MSVHTQLPKSVRDHEVRVGRLARLAAREFGKDERAAYLAGVFHDDGKAVLPPELLAEKEITPEEYEHIKAHAVQGYKELNGRMRFSGLCAGLHHRMGVGEGYGVTLDDIPRELSFHELKKLLDIATIVSIADFIDAYLTRTTSIVGTTADKSLEDLLKDRYPAESVLIQIMLGLTDALYTAKEEL